MSAIPLFDECGLIIHALHQQEDLAMHGIAKDGGCGGWLSI